MFKALDNSTIDDLLGSPTATHISTQHGPLRFIDIELRCASRGCSSPTFTKVNNIPRCTMHALRELNDMVAGIISNEGGTGLDDLPGTL